MGVGAVTEDAVTISSGGAIAVDTAALDAAALSLDAAAERLSDAAQDLQACDRALSRIDTYTLGASGSVVQAVSAISASAQTAAALASALRAASATYALVEWRIARDVAAAAGDGAGTALAEREIAAIEATWPDAAAAADAALADARTTGGDALAQISVGALFSAVLFGPLALAVLVGRSTGRGTVGPGRTVLPGGTAATLVPLPVARPTTPPRTLADAAARIPASGPARIRIEQYARPGGRPAFVVYLTGTRAFGGSDPWDLSSDGDAFSGRRSDALATVEAALTRAGARPGDELYAFGHSLGGMLAGQLEQTGVYDTRVLGTFGSPTAVDVGNDTLSAQVRHTDDPVAALAVGHELPVGAAGSFVAERAADPALGPHDLLLPAHPLDVYAETARAVDGAADPRVVALQQRLAMLGEDGPASVVEFGAERVAVVPRGRVSPSASGAG